MCCTRLAEGTGRKKSPFWHHRTSLSGCIFAAEACIDNRKKLVKHRYLLHTSSEYGELRPTSGWDLLASLGHPYKFQRVLRLGSVTAWHSSSGRQPNFAALNRGRHLYLAGRPSRWALAHILVTVNIVNIITVSSGRLDCCTYVQRTLRSFSRFVDVKYGYVLSQRWTSLSIRWIFNASVSRNSAYRSTSSYN